MSTRTEQPNFSSLQTDIALLKQFNEKVAEPTFKDIQDTQKKIQTALEQLDYVHNETFAEYKAEAEAQRLADIADVKEQFNEARKRTWIQNTLSALAGAVLVMLTNYALNDWLHK